MDKRISLEGLGTFSLPHVQRTSVLSGKNGPIITMPVVGGDGTVPVTVQMVSRTAAELAAQIMAAVTRPEIQVATPALSGEELAALDAWIDRQSDPKPSRSEAIHRLLELGLRQEFARQTETGAL